MQNFDVVAYELEADLLHPPLHPTGTVRTLGQDVQDMRANRVGLCSQNAGVNQGWIGGLGRHGSSENAVLSKPPEAHRGLAQTGSGVGRSTDQNRPHLFHLPWSIIEVTFDY